MAGLNLTCALRGNLRAQPALQIRTIQCQEGRRMHRCWCSKSPDRAPGALGWSAGSGTDSHWDHATSLFSWGLSFLLQAFPTVYSETSQKGKPLTIYTEHGLLQSPGPWWFSHSRVSSDFLRTWKTQSSCEYLGLLHRAFLPFKYMVPIQR